MITTLLHQPMTNLIVYHITFTCRLVYKNGNSNKDKNLNKQTPLYNHLHRPTIKKLYRPMFVPSTHNYPFIGTREQQTVVWTKIEPLAISGNTIEEIPHAHSMHCTQSRYKPTNDLIYSSSNMDFNWSTDLSI